MICYKLHNSVAQRDYRQLLGRTVHLPGVTALSFVNISAAGLVPACGCTPI